MLINYFHKQFKLPDYLMQMVKFPVCEKNAGPAGSGRNIEDKASFELKNNSENYFIEKLILTTTVIVLSIDEVLFIP